MRDIFKLTDKYGRTFDRTKWAVGVTHNAPGKGPLCSSGWIHWYPHPLVAVLMDPVHGDFGSTARLWRGTAGGKKLLDGSGEFILKGGSQTVTLIEELPLPSLTIEQRVTVAIRVVQCVVGNHYPEWSKWAEAWLSGQDRTEKAAMTTETKADAVAQVAKGAVWAVAVAAAEAAWAALAATETVWVVAAEAAARATDEAAWAMRKATTTTQTVLPNLARMLQDVVKQGEPK